MTPPLTLPIIDISPYLPSSTGGNTPPLASSSSSPPPPTRETTSQALHLALRDLGFCYLRVTPFLSPGELTRVLSLARAFFHSDQEGKEAIAIDGERGDGARGYQRLKLNVTRGREDFHEGLDLYAPSPFQDGREGPLSGENPWPTEPAEFQEVFEDWVDKMKILGMAVMEAMSDALEMTKEEWTEWRAMLDEPFWVMRVIGYPELPKGHDGVSCGAHKDYGCLTLLHADPTPGALKVLLRPTPIPGSTAPPPSDESGTWISADPVPGAFVVNVGEMCERWTSGLYRATLHQVQHEGKNYRVSIPFFYEPRFDALVKPLDAAQRILDRGEGAKPSRPYEPVVYGEFLLEKVGGNFSSGKKDKY